MGFFLDLVANLFAAWLADLLTPYGMTGIAVAIAVTVAGAITWHRRQRAVKKPGMASWVFIAVSFTVAALAIVGGAFGLGLRMSSALPTIEPKAKPGTHDAPYVKNQIIASTDIYRNDPQLVLYHAELISTGDRLRIFVDYSIKVPRMSGFGGGWS